MERITLPVTETQMVVDVILKAVAPCTIFVLGYYHQSQSAISLLSSPADSTNTMHHFDLLVFSRHHFPNGASNLANTIAEKSGQRVTVAVLLHKVTDLTTQQASQQWFFDQVLRNGQRLHLDTTAPPYLLNSNPVRDVASDRGYWLKCVGVAQFNLQAAGDSEQLEVTLCKIALLHTASSQIALGLLRVFLGYTPNEFGLKYLLQLCGQFTALPTQLFKQSTPEAVQRFKMLCAPPAMLNHWSRLNASEQDFLWLLEACQEFLRLATDIVTPELIRLENTFTTSL